MDFSLCICTFRRPALLNRLLDELSRYDFTRLQGEIVIVDNDPDASGLPVIEQWRDRLPLPIQGLHTSPPNIARARNTGIAASRGAWIMLIDDDEWPEPGWLQSMFQTQARHNADVVVGPVVPQYAEDVPQWIRRGQFFAPRPYCTDDILRSNQTYSGNTLIRRAALQGIPGPFDIDYGVTGGSDVILFSDMEKRGAVMVWCNEAVVYEIVPRSRANFPWLLRRSYSHGQIYIRMLTRHLGKAPTLGKAILGAKAIAKFFIASGFALILLPFGRTRSVQWMRKASSQLGQLTGLAGARFDAYDPQAKRRGH